MEDPFSAMEESIQEYSTEESSGKVSWLLNEGLTVGKKILVTSFVISSAPVVLPPLVVISVLGLACSVPYGLLLASYACTNKIMSKLLPGSEPPPFLLDFVWHKGGIDMEEEKEMLEDTRGTIEKRIELVENGNDANETVEENGYKEDVAEYEEEPTQIEVEVRIEEVGEDEEKVPVTEKSLDQLPVNEMLAVVVDIEGDEKGGGTFEDVVVPFEVTDIVVELCQHIEITEDEELVNETRGLVEKIREEGMTDNGEKDKQSAENISGDAEEGHRQVKRNAEEVGMPLEDIIGSKPLGEREQNKDEVVKESSKVQEIEQVQNADIILREKHSKGTVGGLLAKKDTDNILGAEKPVMIGTTDVSRDKEQTLVVNKPFMSEGGVNDSITEDVEQDIQLNKEKEKMISSNADARKIADESGFDLSDNKNAAAHADYNTVRENEYSSSYNTSLETVDFTALPVFSGEHKSDGAAVPSQAESGMTSSKAEDSEEKTWEQIEAMRRIVGYKAAAQATCIEEVKALYVFTGVEPPALFKEPADLVEVNDKLRFLMSIIGVK